MTDLQQIPSDERYKMILERLAQARTQAGLSQSQAARLLGVESPSTISQYENGHRKIDIQTFTKLATLYDVSETWLLTGYNPDFDPSKWLEMAQLTRITMEDFDKLIDVMQSLRHDNS
jgi:transcriptional regulator with XRE-family HTH domain